MGEICGGDQRPRRHVSGSVLSIRLRTLLAPTTPTARSFRGPKAKKNFPLSPIGAGFLISTLETLISNKSAIHKAVGMLWLERGFISYLMVLETSKISRALDLVMDILELLRDNDNDLDSSQPSRVV
ncbi:hypothetical protein OROGR_001823 [Orobanche gracilis]